MSLRKLKSFSWWCQVNALQSTKYHRTFSHKYCVWTRCSVSSAEKNNFASILRNESHFLTVVLMPAKTDKLWICFSWNLLSPRGLDSFQHLLREELIAKEFLLKGGEFNRAFTVSLPLGQESFLFVLIATKTETFFINYKFCFSFELNVKAILCSRRAYFFLLSFKGRIYRRAILEKSLIKLLWCCFHISQQPDQNFVKFSVTVNPIHTCRMEY